MMDAWAEVSSFAINDQQLIWIRAELDRHPLLAGQDPFSWLLWRTKIAEGLSDQEAWDWVRANLDAQQAVESNAQGGSGRDEVEMYGQGGGAAGAVMGSDGKEEQNYDLPRANQPIAYPGGPSEVNAMAQPPMAFADDAFQQYVQMNDILPLPSDAVPYEDIDVDPAESAGDSGSDISSSGDSQITKNAITALPGSAPPPKSAVPGATSHLYNQYVPGSQPNSRDASPFQQLDPPLRPKPSNLSIPRTNAIASSSTSTTPAARQPSKSRSPTRIITPVPVATPAPDAPVTMSTIRPLIARSYLRADSVRPVPLWKLLRKGKDGEDPRFQPDPAELREILVAIRENAPHAYKQEMAGNFKYAEQLNRYLKAMAKDAVKWEVAIYPMLMLLSETLMSRENFEDTKIAKSVRVVADKAKEKNLDSSPQVQTAFARYKDYCAKKIITQRKTPDPAADEPAKKRKLEEAEGPAKKSAAASGKTAPIPTAAASKTPNGAAGPSKLPSTTNAAPPKSAAPAPAAADPPSKRPKILPGFKKREASEGAAAIPSPTTPTGPPQSLLAQTMAMMARAKKSTAAASRIPIPEISDLDHDPKKVYVPQPNKKGHTVRFSDDVPGTRPLVQIRLIEAREEDPEQHGVSAHDMDMNEGMLLKKHLEEDGDATEEAPKELIEWYQPDLYVESPLPGPTPEALAQEARERGLLSVPGGTAADETGVIIAPPQPLTQYMLHPGIKVPAPPVQDVIAGLLSTLGTFPFPLNPGAAGGPSHTANQYGQAQHPVQHPYQNGPPYHQYPDPHQQQNGYAGPSQYNNGYNAHGGGLPGQQGWQAGPGPGPGGYQHNQGYDQQQGQGGGGSRAGAWGGAQPQAWQGGEEDRSSGGKRGKGGKGGRGGKGGGKYTVACSFFAQGHCAKGSKCDFRH